MINPRYRMALIFALIICLVPTEGLAVKRSLTFGDIMKFREIHDFSISKDGRWMVINARPDRGDGEVVVFQVTDGIRRVIPRGVRPRITPDGAFAGALVKPPAGSSDRKKKNDLVLLHTRDGSRKTYQRVKEFAFSGCSQWLAFLEYEPEGKDDGEHSVQGKNAADPTPPGKEKKDSPKIETCTLRVLRLGSFDERVFLRVTRFAFEPEGRYLVFEQIGEEENRLVGMDLASGRESVLTAGPEVRYSNFSWSEKKGRMGLVSFRKDDGGTVESALWIWEPSRGKLTKAVGERKIPAGWIIPADNELRWTRDEKRLFFGIKPLSEYRFYHPRPVKEEEADGKENPFDIQRILQDRTVDVWGWQDPRIIPQQKKQWDRFAKRTYRAVFHYPNGGFVQLADLQIPEVRFSQNARVALGNSEIPYLKEITWDGWYRDVYVVDLKKGSKTRILTRHGLHASLSPGGKYLTYFKGDHWYIYDIKSRRHRCLTGDISTPFFDEDFDYPPPRSSYGIGGWLEGDRAILLYDKYDIWRFDLPEGKCVNLTGGRQERMRYRVVSTEEKKEFIDPDRPLLLLSYHTRQKNNGFYQLHLAERRLERLLEDAKKFRFLKKANDADRLFYTRESFAEFPDIWTADRMFKTPARVTRINPQIGEFLWGSTELVEWRTLDGREVQGVLIKPENFRKGQRYPVIVYYYHFFSHLLHDFNQMVVNHRPNFPYFVSNGYCLFLPDIPFTLGTPGFSATKSIVPGIHKLVEMGVADPDAIGLHGHSWSGYQTAFVITQTDMFAAAVAGAPVANMTSAYSGIRWESGLARQFQYEKSQSRIGGSLWEYPERYIENSPVFFLDRVATPLLIQFGDADGAVPWYQGIELYLGMRRLQKPCFFLQYRNEPHHLKKYANKLDYSIRMKEFFDHYLKGTPMPGWMKNPVPFRRKGKELKTGENP